MYFFSCGIFGWGFGRKKKPGVESRGQQRRQGESQWAVTFLLSFVVVFQAVHFSLELSLDGCVSIRGTSRLLLVDIPAHLDTLALEAALFIKGHVLL